MLFDKPVINTVFGDGDNGLKNDQRFLKYAHIKKVVESNAVSVAKNEDELIVALNTCLETPLYKIEAQQKLTALQIGKPLEGTSNRITATLRSWCSMKERKKIAVVCNYGLTPNRVGGMDRFFWLFDKKCKENGHVNGLVFSQY